jgi:hypothetical protein
VKKATYTPGPWSIDSFGVVVGSKGEFIAEIFGPDENNFELIVSAPDLYEALEALYDITIRMMLNIPNSGFEPNSPLGKCEAALAKARGEK